MRRLVSRFALGRGMPLIVVAVALSACGEADKTVAQATATGGPSSFANIMVSPSAYAGQSVEFKASLAVGKIVTPFGERTKLVSHSWEYPPGTKHSIGAPADVPEGRCIFLAKGDGGAPAFPLQVIVTDSLTPCMAGSVPQLLVGKVGGVEDVKLIVNDQPSIVKALTLSEPALKTPN